MARVWDRVAARIGPEEDPTVPTGGTMGAGRTFMVWLAANMVVTTMLTGTLFVPGIPYVTALWVIVGGSRWSGWRCWCWSAPSAPAPACQR